jgi:NAD(P)H-hydrate epimerase
MKQTHSPHLEGINLVDAGSHKGQNGRLLIIGGSHLFHAASIWALQVASRIVDLVHYASVPENNEIVARAKDEFRNGIVVSRADIDAYIEEDDCVLIGPGMTRDQDTEMVTHRVLRAYPNKQWVIDAGALQMIQLADIPNNAILTPHHGEFAALWQKRGKNDANTDQERVALFAKEYHCIVLLKGEKDLVCGSDGQMDTVSGGNAGMTKGGTGDVLAGLIAALACKHDPYNSTRAGSYINKYAGDALYKSVGPFFNASDLALEIPKVMNELLIQD